MYKFIKTPNKDDRKDLVNIKVSIVDDISGYDLADSFRAFMLACGFHPETVSDIFNEEVENED